MSDGKRYLLVGAIMAVVVGGILFVVGLQERKLAATASQVPEEITLKDLIARGPNGNPNIILKDFVLCENFVYKTRGPVWEAAWVPAIPREAMPPGQKQGGRPAAVQAIIFTINASSEQDLFQRCGQARLPALVTNGLVSLGSQEQALLQQSYPGTDFTRCLIIQEGREPAGVIKQVVMIGGGGLLTLIGLGLGGFMGVQWYLEPPKPRRKRRSRDDEDDDDDDDDDRPRRKRPSRDEDEEERPRRAKKSRRDGEEKSERPKKSRKPRRDEEE